MNVHVKDFKAGDVVVILKVGNAARNLTEDERIITDVTVTNVARKTVAVEMGDFKRKITFVQEISNDGAYLRDKSNWAAEYYLFKDVETIKDMFEVKKLTQKIKNFFGDFSTKVSQISVEDCRKILEIIEKYN